MVVEGVGPNDLSGYSNADYDQGYLLTATPEVPSNTVVVIDSYLFLDNGVSDNILRNKNHDDTGDANIHVRGSGTLDANGANQTRFSDETQDSFRNCGISFYNVEGWSIRGVTVAKANAWAIKPERVYNGFVSGVDLDNQQGRPNQDGIHFIGPWEDVNVSNVTGETSDDGLGITGITNADFAYGNGSRGNVPNGGSGSGYTATNITINSETYSGIRIIADSTHSVGDINITAIEHTATGDNNSQLVTIGAGKGGGYDAISNISISNATTDTHLVRLQDQSRNVTINNVHTTGEHGEKILKERDNGTRFWTLKDVSTAVSSDTTAIFDFENNGHRDLTVEGVAIVGDNSTHSDRKAISQTSSGSLALASATFSDVYIQNFDTGVDLTSLSIVDHPARFERFAFDNVGVDYNISNEPGLLIEGQGEESAGSGSSPTASNWVRGAEVENVSDGTLWKLLRDGSTWKQIA